VPLVAKSFRDSRIFGLDLEQLAGTAGGAYLRIQATVRSRSHVVIPRRR
jgi:hypothetical protein